MLGLRNEGMTSSLHFLLRRATSGPISPAGSGPSVWADQHAMSKYWNPGSRRDNEKERERIKVKNNIIGFRRLRSVKSTDAKSTQKSYTNLWEAFKRWSVWRLKKKKKLFGQTIWKLCRVSESPWVCCAVAGWKEPLFQSGSQVFKTFTRRPLE